MKKNHVIDKSYVDFAVSAGLFPSKSAGNRMIKNGGAYLNNKKVADPLFMITLKDLIGEKYLLLSVGKKNKVLIQILKEHV